MRKKKVILIIISVILLLLGLLLYLLLNRKAFVSQVLLRVIPLQTNTSDGFVIRILRSFGADLLWSMSFTMIIQFIVWFDKKKTLFLILCSVLGIFYELLQCFGITTGTADIVDVFVYILGSILAIIIIEGGRLYEEKSDSSSNNGN